MNPQISRTIFDWTAAAQPLPANPDASPADTDNVVFVVRLAPGLLNRVSVVSATAGTFRLSSAPGELMAASPALPAIVDRTGTVIRSIGPDATGRGGFPTLSGSVAGYVDDAKLRVLTAVDRGWLDVIAPLTLVANTANVHLPAVDTPLVSIYNSVDYLSWFFMRFTGAVPLTSVRVEFLHQPFAQ